MGLEANAAGHHPEIAPTAYVHPTATVIGRVCVGDRAFVGPQAVIRADEAGPDGTIEPIVISGCANVQDCAVIHALGGTGVTIGPRSSIAHAAIIHGPCKIGAGCFVGFNSVVFRATVGSDVVILHQSLVEGVAIPSGCAVPSGVRVACDEDVCQLKPTPSDLTEFAARVVQANVQLVERVLKRRQVEMVNDALVSITESSGDTIELQCIARAEDSAGLHWTMTRNDVQDLARWWSTEDIRVKSGQRSIRDKECGNVLVSMFTPSVIHVRVRDRFGNIKVVGYSFPRAVLEHLDRRFSEQRPDSHALSADQGIVDPCSRQS